MDLTFRRSEEVLSIRVRAIFFHEGRLLILRDIEKIWYLSGGRVRLGETFTEALEREVEEEVGIKAKATRLLWFNENFYVYKGKSRQDFTFYYLMDFEGTDLLSRGDEFETMENGIPHIFRWVTPAELEKTVFFPPFIKEKIKHIPESPEMGWSKYDSIPLNKIDMTFRTENDWFNVRVCAVYVNEGKLLAMHDGKSPFYYLPGGRIHLGERVMEGLSREVGEELEIEPIVERPLWICQSFFDSVNHPGERTHEICFYFLMKPTAELLARGNEFYIEEEQTDHFEWLPVDGLSDEYIYPLFVRERMKDLPDKLEVIVERQ